MAASQLPTARQPADSPPDATAPTRHGTGATLPGALAPSEGLVLGRYRLQRRLGSGAFGTVWLAHDERLDRAVAVKAVPRERVSGARLAREARAAARLSHPAIVTLFETAVDDDCAYLVSEAVRGETLHALLADRRLSDRDVVAIAIGLCDALEHAHERGVIHRDVKPSNILVPEAPSSSAHPVKLTDFGVARVLGGDSLTRVGDVVGTAAYMAPEQAEGLEAGPAADLYALALVVYEALTGCNPVRHTMATRARRLGTYLPPLRRTRRDLPRGLGQAIDLALRPRPRERGTIADLRDALRQALPVLDDTPGQLLPPQASSDTSSADEPLPRRAPAPRREAPMAATVGLPAAEPPRPRPRPHRRPGRPGIALLGAVAAAWSLSRALPADPAAPALAGLAAAAALFLLPRLGWLLVTAGVAGVAGVAGRPGVALIALLALPLPVLIPPAPRALRRAGAAATGWIWLALAAPLAGHDLLLSRPVGTPRPEQFAHSLSLTANQVIVPLMRGGAPAGALVCAVAAVLAGWLLRIPGPPARILLTVMWAGAATVALGAAVDRSAAAGGVAHLRAPGLLGAAAALGVLAWSARPRPRRGPRDDRPGGSGETS